MRGFLGVSGRGLGRRMVAGGVGGVSTGPPGATWSREKGGRTRTHVRRQIASRRKPIANSQALRPATKRIRYGAPALQSWRISEPKPRGASRTRNAGRDRPEPTPENLGLPGEPGSWGPARKRSAPGILTGSRVSIRSTSTADSAEIHPSPGVPRHCRGVISIGRPREDIEITLAAPHDAVSEVRRVGRGARAPAGAGGRCRAYLRASAHASSPCTKPTRARPRLRESIERPLKPGARAVHI